VPLPFTPLLIDVLDLEKNGLYQSFGSTTKITAPMVVRSNGLYLSIRPMQATNTGSPPWQDIPDIASATISASIDVPDLLPTQGTWFATFGANSTAALPYNIGPSNLQNALNGLASIISAGGVTVIQSSAEDDFIITFNNNGAQGAITGATINLYPASGITTVQDQIGTSSLPSIQTLSIQQLPATFTSNFTAFPGAAYTCVILTTGGSGVNNLQVLTLNPLPYAGTFTITTTYGTSGPIQWSAVGNDIATALNAIGGTPANTWLASGLAGGPWDITNTTGTSISALTATLTGLVVPIGVTGELLLATPGMIARFNSLPAGTLCLAANLEITVQYPGYDPETILLVPITVMRSVIISSVLTPPYYGAPQIYDPINSVFYALTAPNQIATLTLSSGAGVVISTVYDPTNKVYYSVTAPNGQLTLTAL
jgi:hypothetical protein